MLFQQASFHCDHVQRIRIIGNWMTHGELAQSNKIYLLTGGKGKLHLDCGTYNMHAGRVMIYSAGTMQIGESDPAAPLEKIYIHFRAMTGGVLQLLRFAPPPICLEGEAAANMIALGDQLLAEWEQDYAVRSLATNALLMQMLLMAYRADEADRRAADGPAVINAEQGASRDHFEAVGRVLAVMTKHIDEPLSLVDLAECANLSPAHFGEVFKRLVGRSPMKFLESIRMQRAQQLLAQTEATVSEIAQQVGYRDPNYFSRAFCRHTRSTPSSYRNSLRVGDPGKIQ